ncbi:S-4TM family putative pore-forming effector [Micromonospora sp. WMMD1128]|uniref:S-4TM family putative pore-forming effector n=1 Tax=Micromonospora sp. WMMD1128 TaxID=3015150 RepID=UPI00248B2B1F|nr:S-4TM family putative pore-forming effector [Micromonospora sp. WMMD1128]WBB72604.1 S-4TM family putative pore-forming effector [Micromonospora sp. WMMD1128]
MTDRTDSLLRRRQTEPGMMSMLRAMSVCYSRAQRLDGLRTSASAGIAGAGATVAFTGVSTTVVTALGALWAVTNALGLASWSRGQLRRAATIQEMFDVDLFGLPWNEVAAGERVTAPEISRLDRAFRGTERYLRDYYEIPDLPAPYDVLACQQQSLGWGARLRRRYAHTVLAVVAAWAATGVVYGVLADLTVAHLLLAWFVPSLGALLLGVEIYRGQRDVAVERDRASAVVNERITSAVRDASAAADLLGVARQVQDLLFRTRCTQARVPNCFFRRFHAADRVDFQSTMTGLGHLLNRPAPGGAARWVSTS